MSKQVLRITKRIPESAGDKTYIPCDNKGEWIIGSSSLHGIFVQKMWQWQFLANAWGMRLYLHTNASIVDVTDSPPLECPACENSERLFVAHVPSQDKTSYIMYLDCPACERRFKLPLGVRDV